MRGGNHINWESLAPNIGCLVDGQFFHHGIHYSLSSFWAGHTLVADARRSGSESNHPRSGPFEMESGIWHCKCGVMPFFFTIHV